MAVGYAGFVVLLWRLGLFDVPDDGPDARVFAAVFALVGALFAAILTFVGALLKHSIDMRTFELSRQTEARLASENQQTDSRLRLEAAIRAVDLLGTTGGKKSPSTKQAGSLFVLADLGQLELALALLEQAWSSGDISSRGAMWVVERGLADPSPDVQFDAATIYHDHAATLIDTTTGVRIPTRMRDWPTDVDGDVRFLILKAVLRASADNALSACAAQALAGVIQFLHRVYDDEPEKDIQASAGCAVGILIDAVGGGSIPLTDGGEPVHLSKLREDLPVLDKDIHKGFPLYRSLVELRAQWPPGVGWPPRSPAPRSP